MEQVNITIALDPLRLDALEYFLKLENTSVQKQMDEALKKLYEEKVPETMRGYLDWKQSAASKAKRPAPKPANKPQPKVTPPQAAPSKDEQEKKNMTEGRNDV